MLRNEQKAAPEKRAGWDGLREITTRNSGSLKKWDTDYTDSNGF